MSLPLLAAYGSAIADVVCRVSHAELTATLPDLVPGNVRLISSALQREIQEKLGRQCTIVPGGSAANTLRAARKSGVAARFISAVAEDSNGIFVRRALAGAGIDCSPFIAVSGAATDCVLNLVTPDGERTMLPHIDAGSRIIPEDIDGRKILDGVAHLHFEGYSLRNSPVLFKLAGAAEEMGIPTSLDLAAVSLIEDYRRELKEFFRITVPRWLFFNRSEGFAFTGCREARDAALAALEFCQGAVATDGADGAWCALRGAGSQPVHFPALPPERLVDTIGAGDTWNGTFLAAQLLGMELEEAGSRASAAAAYVIAREGADL
jgi:sugar/nucleoside kinase (ribokinase family)